LIKTEKLNLRRLSIDIQYIKDLNKDKVANRKLLGPKTDRARW